TLVGTGGCGKTRLAIELARAERGEFPAGVWFVDLVPCASDGDVVAAVAQVLGVYEQPGKGLESLVVAAIASRSMLLVLDNCEHMLDACAGVATRLLMQCARLRVLATSREALGVIGERVYRVPSLTLPGKHRDSDAVRLLVERAALVRPEFRLAPNR